jgi:hypothetical protein
MSVKPRARPGRKLLIASVGVATLSFVGADCTNTSVANLPAPPSCLERPEDPYCYGPRPGPGDAGDAGADGDASPDDASIGS